MNLKQKIDDLYNKSRSKSYVHNLNYLYSILQIKVYNSTLRDYNYTFYKDINLLSTTMYWQWNRKDMAMMPFLWIKF